MREAQLRHTTLAVQEAELELLVADDRGAVGAPLGVHARPGLELIGDLVDERGGIGHEPIVLACRETSIAVPVQKAETGPMTHASQQVGRSARQRAPRSAHAVWEAAPDRVDVIATLEAQAETRTPQLVPVRYGRMARSPFAFYRGAAAIMAGDLAATPSPDCARSCAETRTWRTSACSPRRIAASSSISTTSTRPCRDRGSGTSSGWRRASWSRRATAGSTRRRSATPSSPG